MGGHVLQCTVGMDCSSEMAFFVLGGKVAWDCIINQVVRPHDL